MNDKKKVNLSPIANLYAGSLKKYGAQSVGVGWPDPGSHKLRFDKLVSVVDQHSTGISINDLGCGYGALYEYLIDSGVSVSHYRGYDISKEMLLEAEKRLPHEYTELLDSPELNKSADYSFASGIFNVRFEENEKKWLEYIKRTLANINNFSSKGFAFNLLSTYVDYRKEHLFYGDPLFFFDYCKKEFSPYVSLLHDYPLFEWTITVRKL